MITFSRASSGTALTKVGTGPELVTNGGFDDASNWTGQWTISGGVASADSVAVSNPTLNQNIGAGNKHYEVTLDIVSTNGTGVLEVYHINLGANAIFDISTTGTKTVRLFGGTHASNGQLSIRARAGFIGSIDNVSVKELVHDQVNGTLQLFNHPANQPRVEYDYQGNRLGLLVEEARTNTIGDSNVFLSDIGTAVSSSAETSPDGTTTATQVVTSGASVHRIRRTAGAVTATGVAYAYSVFVKSDEVSYIQLLNGGDANYFATFDLVNETVGATGSATTGTITKYPNGWYRITALYDGTGNYAATGYIYAAASASATYGQAANTPGLTFHLFGAQNEAGSFPTSYIPTTGATATRSADVASIGVGAFGYNAQGGTVVVTADWYPGSNFLVSNRAALEIGDGGVSERLLIYNHDGFAGRGFMKGVLFGDQTGSGARITDDQAKVALVFADANQAHCVDGGSIDTGSAAMLAGTTIMKIGPTLRTGHISSIAYYPRRLTDAQIKALTSPPETPTLSLTFDDSSTSYLETSIHG